MNVPRTIGQPQQFQDLVLHLSLVIAGQRLVYDRLIVPVVPVDSGQAGVRQDRDEAQNH